MGLSLCVWQRDGYMALQHPIWAQDTYATTGGARNESYLENAALSGNDS